MRAVLPLLLALACGGVASAQTPSEPKTVSPLVVYPPTPAPKIASSYPAQGQAVPGGVLVIKVTFDQPMLDLAFAFGPAPVGDPPDCLKTPRLLEDKRTFVLLCTVATGKAYALAFNAGPEAGFANVGSHRAEPAVLAFQTTGEVGPRDIGSALKAASLNAGDVPIQEDPYHTGRRNAPD